MVTFNLRKKWFDKIKSGEKTHEYRETKEYWAKRITKVHVNDVICFTLGYPKKGNKCKTLYAEVLSVSIVNGIYTDLKTDKNVFDINFKLLN